MITVGRTYKITKVAPLEPGRFGRRHSYHIAVPPEIGDVLPVNDLRFYVELTPEGILFRPSKPDPEVPDWATAASEN